MTQEHPLWHDRIVRDPEIMVGKPVIKGTRIPVERILAHLAHEPDLADLFAIYPELDIEDVKAALEFARAAVADMPPRPRTRRSAHSAHA